MTYPGVILTEIRSRVLGTDGQPVGKEAEERIKGRALSPEDCAAKILKAAAARKREWVMGFAATYLAPILKTFIPGPVDAMARQAMGSGKK